MRPNTLLSIVAIISSREMRKFTATAPECSMTCPLSPSKKLRLGTHVQIDINEGTSVGSVPAVIDCIATVALIKKGTLGLDLSTATGGNSTEDHVMFKTLSKVAFTDMTQFFIGQKVSVRMTPVDGHA